MIWISLTVVEIKQKRAHVFVINFSSTIGFVLRDDFTTILGNKFIFLYRLFQKDAPASNIRRSHKEMFAFWFKKRKVRYLLHQTRYESDIRNPRWTLTFLQVILDTSCWSAPQVPHKSGSHSRTAKKHGHCLVLHCALQRQPGNLFWPTNQTIKFYNISNHFIVRVWKLTIWTALTEFFTKILGINARTVCITRLARMIARSEVVNVIRRSVFFQLDFPTMNRPQA